jgi:Na+/H+-dicarboxylate symporter
VAHELAPAEHAVTAGAGAGAYWKRMLAGLVRRYLDTSLGTRMAIASCLGMAAGWILGERTAWLEPLATNLVQVLGLLAPVLVLALVPGALLAVRPASLGASMLRVLPGFLLVAAAAAAAGVAAGLVLGPTGARVQFRSTDATGASWSQLWQAWSPAAPWTAERAVPLALVLAVVAVLALRLWIAVRRAPDAPGSLRQLLGRVAGASSRGVARLLEWAPPCVFVLAAVAAGRSGPMLATASAGAFFAVYATHAVLFLLFLAVPLVLQQSPRVLLRSCQEALWTALATGSSAATLPVELRAVERGLGVDCAVARVLVPLGVAVSKAGTTAFLAAVTVVAGRAAGADLTPAWLAGAALSAVAAGVLTPPVAGGGILMLGMLAPSLGLPLELAAMFGAVPFIGRLNTPLNALGRMVVTWVACVRVVAPAGGATDRAEREC